MTRPCLDVSKLEGIGVVFRIHPQSACSRRPQSAFADVAAAGTHAIHGELHWKQDNFPKGLTRRVRAYEHVQERGPGMPGRTNKDVLGFTDAFHLLVLRGIRPCEHDPLTCHREFRQLDLRGSFGAKMQ